MFVNASRGFVLALVPIILTASSFNLSARSESTAAAYALEENSLSSPINSEAKSGGVSTPEVNLKGIVSAYDGPSPHDMVSHLLRTALDHNEKREHILKKDKEYHGVAKKSLSVVKQVAHYATEYRGFEMSSEGADVILDEKVKLKSTASIDYVKQQQVDELHMKISSSMMQMAQGLGMSDPSIRQRTVDAGLNQLRQLVDEQDAQKALSSLKAWSEQLNVPDSIYKQQPWSMMDIQAKTEQLLKDASQSDPVIGLVRRALHKYNGHSKLALAGAKMINTTLAIAMFSPTVVSPAAQVLQFVYQMATGGPEDSKLLAELYLDKRLESRFHRINQESNQAINAYNNALMTKNPVLLGYSESIISSMASEETGSKIIGHQHLVARQSTHDDDIDCLQTHNAM